MRYTILPLLIWGLALTPRAIAQSAGSTPNTLTNQDVVLLARAGFNEDFLIDLISNSRTRFDTSATALAELVKQGLTERLIRVMLNLPEASSRSTVGPVGPAAGTAMVPIALYGAEGNRRGRPSKVKEGKPTESMLAIANQAPYSHSSSFLWGLWKSKTGVEVNPSQKNLNSTLGVVYSQVRINSAAAPVQYVLVP